MTLKETGKSTETETFIVTGGAGFLGSHLTERLLRDYPKSKVIVIDNYLSGTKKNLSDIERKERKRLEIYEVDVCNDFIWTTLENPDVVFNLACPASPVDYRKHPIETLMVGSKGMWNVLEFCKRRKAMLVHTSTSEVYGDPLVSPQSETYWGNVNPIGERSMYDESKRFSEALIMAYIRKYDVEAKIARIFNSYGPRMKAEDGRAVPNFITQALLGKPLTVYGDGKQTRSLCYYEDTIDGLIKLAKYGDVGPYNIGNPHEITMAELAETIKRMCKSKSEIKFMDLPSDDPKVRCPDIRKMATIGWTPQITLQEGLSNTIKWFRDELDGR